MKNSNTKMYIALGALALLLAVAPANALADNDKNKKNRNEVKAEVKIERKNKTCLRAFGHLISPGWLKTNANVEIHSNCWLPFGISKKFQGGANIPDTVAPVISDIKTEVKLNSALVSLETNEKANATVFYGTVAGLDINNSATLRVSRNDMDKDQEIKILNLAANTKYYAIIQVKDKAGNTSVSSEFSFTTKAPVVEGDVVAPTISAVVASSTNSSVSVGWKTNEPATSKVLYGTSSPLNTSSTSTLSVESTDLKTTHLMTVPNLSANTNYYLIIQSKDVAGNIQSSTEFSAKTGI